MSEWTDAQEQRLRALIDGAQEDCAGRFAQLERIESENELAARYRQYCEKDHSFQ